MCKTKRSIVASTPRRRPHHPISTSAMPASSASAPSTSESLKPSSSSSSASTTTATTISLSSIRLSLPSPPALYPFEELSSATNHFLAPRLPSSSAAWRCHLRGRDAVVFQHDFHGEPSSLQARLSSAARLHHSCLARFLGASLSGPTSIYLAYEHIVGSPLSFCLRNPRNPSFTPLSSWLFRIQVAADIASGLDYLHNHSGFSGGVHNRIKSSAIIVTEPDLHARICHSATADLTGELEDDDRRRRRPMRISGTRGYIAPEILAGGVPSHMSDVYAYGVVLLELVTGDEPAKYRREGGRVDMVSVVDGARSVMGSEERLRRWVDSRLRDSFPVEVVMRTVRLALECVEEEAGKRPEMVRVAGKVSQLLLQSREWADQLRVPDEFSVSWAPR